MQYKDVQYDAAQILKLLPRLQRLTESGTKELAMLQGSSDGRYTMQGTAESSRLQSKQYGANQFKTFRFPSLALRELSGAVLPLFFHQAYGRLISWHFSQVTHRVKLQTCVNLGCGTNACRTSLGFAMARFRP